MSVSNITTIQRPISLPPSREQRINRIDNQINANNREINALESQITAQKEVSAATKELITNNSETINLTKELLGSSNRKIGLLENLVGAHQEQRGLLQESRDLLQKMIDVTEQILAIMEKNPAKYGGLSNAELQKLPQVVETKNQMVASAGIVVTQYPKAEHMALTKTVGNVVDATFSEIDSTADIEVNRDLFSNLGKRIEAALDKKHESLIAKDKAITQIMKAHYYKPLGIFAKINKLAFLDLAIKDFKA